MTFRVRGPARHARTQKSNHMQQGLKPMLSTYEFTWQSLDKWALWNCCFQLCFWIKIPCLDVKTVLVLKKSVTEVSPPLPRVQLSMNPHFPTTNTSIGKFLPSSQWWALIYSFSKSPELLPESAIARLWLGRRQPLWDSCRAAIWVCVTGTWVLHWYCSWLASLVSLHTVFKSFKHHLNQLHKQVWQNWRT